MAARGRPAAILLAACVAAACAWAQPATPEAQAEIKALIATLAGSGCEFERNGRWYGADRAQEHLRRKHEWLRRRGLAPTAELFIERAATSSSVSGRAYRVRCPPDLRPEPAADWFRARLAGIRSGT